MNFPNERADSFHEGQVWASPRGFLYRVVSVERGGNAVLRLRAADASRRKVIREWDAVNHWILYKDAETKAQKMD